MHRALRQTAVYFLTIAVSQGLSFLLLPIATAYLSPETYGEYTLALSLSSLVGTVGSTWVRNVSFRLFWEARRAERTRAFFVTVAATQATLVVALYLPTALLVGHTRYLSLPVMLSAGAATLAADFYAHTVSLLRAEQRAAQYSIAEISSAAVRFAVTLAGLAAGVRSPSLLFLAAALASAALGAYAAIALRPRLTGPARMDWRGARDLVRWAPASLPFSVSGWAEKLMDRLVLDHYLSRAVVGVYTANYAIADRIVGGITAAVFMMAWPDILASWSEGGKPRTREAVTRALNLYLWLTVGPAVCIAVFHRELAHLLGAAYRGGSGIMPIVVAATWLWGFNGYLNRHLELGLRFAVLSWVAFGGAVLNLVMNLLLVPRIGLQGAALATLTNYVATGLFFWFTRDRELVRLPLDTIASVALSVSFLSAGGTIQRPATFAVAYAAGAAYFVSRRFRTRPVPIEAPPHRAAS
jgi:O-antigen/teichoic acid export membrane protein